MSRQKLSLSQIKDLVSALDSRYTKTEVDAIITATEATWNGNLSTLESTFQAAVNDLETRMTSAEGRLDAHDLSIASLVAADSAESQARVDGDAANAAAISAEETRATAAEAVIQGNVDAEAVRAASAEAVIQSNLDAEALVRAEADSALDSRVSALEGVDGVYDTRMSQIEQSVSDEALARQSADTQHSADILSLQSGIANTNSDLNNEIANRVAGDANLQTQIDALSSQSGTGIGALETRVTAVEAKDVEQDGRLDTVEAGLAAEITRATGVEADLQAQITTLDGNASSSITAIEGRLDSVEAKDVEQDGRLDTVEAGVSTNAADIAALDTASMKKADIVQEAFTATAAQTVFSLATPVASVFIAMVMVNGVQQLMGSDFSLSGSTLTFFYDLEAGDEVQATYFNK